MANPHAAHHAAEKAALQQHFPGTHAVVKHAVTMEGEQPAHNMSHHKHMKHRKGFSQPDATDKGVGSGTANGKSQPDAIGKGHAKHR